MAANEDEVREAAVREMAQRELERRARTMQPDKGERPETLPMSRPAAFGNFLGQGLSFGTSDELAAGLSAIPRLMPGGVSPREQFDSQLATERQNLQQAYQQYPGMSLAGGVVGGVMQGGGLANLLKPVLKNVPNLLRVSALGAAEGGAFGFGSAEGNPVERLDEAAQGAAIGAVAAPLVSGGVTLSGKLLSKIGGPITRMAANTPKSQAARIVGRAAELDDLGPDAVQAELSRLGSRGVLADLGPNLTGLARGVSGRSSRGRSIAHHFLNDRQAGQQMELLGETGEFRDSFARWMRSRISSADDLYAAARQKPVRVNETLSAIIKRPAVARSLQQAQRELRSGNRPFSHIELFDLTKQNLDDEIGALLRAGRKAAAGRLIETRRAMLAEIDNQIPEYAQARQLFAGEAALRDAANLGSGIFRGSKNVDDLRLVVEEMTAGEREAFRRGAVRGLIDRVEGIAGDRNAAKAITQSTKVKDLLRLAFPNEQTFNDFLNKAQAESVFTNTRNTVLSGSRTAEFQQDIMDLQRGTGALSALREGSDVIGGGLRLLQELGISDVSDETLEEVSKLLFNRNLTQRQVNNIAGVPLIPRPSLPLRQGGAAGATGATIGAAEIEQQ